MNDDALLLRRFAGDLRGSNAFGAFAGDSLMKLGLIGTVIGFIMMLAPIAGLDAGNQLSIKSSMSMMSDGLFGAIFPVYAKDAANLSTVEIANVIALGAIVTTIVSIPSGTLMDIYGRKRNLVPGLFLLGLAAYLLAHITDMGTVLLMMAVNGIGQGISLGVTQVYAMDLAPAERRGEAAPGVGRAQAS